MSIKKKFMRKHKETMENFETARSNMINSQLRPNKVSDLSILNAFASIPREAFVPESFKNVAYMDEDLILDDERFAIKPMVLAKLIQIGNIEPDDVVLTIGCDTGYAGAILSKLASTVIMVQPDEKKADTISSKLVSLGIDNCVVVVSENQDGYQKQAPYDVIFFAGAIQEIPEKIKSQLSENGKIIAIGQWDGDQISRAATFTKQDKNLSSKIEFDASIPVLSDFTKQKQFEF